MICPRCGEENPEGTKFCVGCSTALAACRPGAMSGCIVPNAVTVLSTTDPTGDFHTSDVSVVIELLAFGLGTYAS